LISWPAPTGPRSAAPGDRPRQPGGIDRSVRRRWSGSRPGWPACRTLRGPAGAGRHPRVPGTACQARAVDQRLPAPFDLSFVSGMGNYGQPIEYGLVLEYNDVSSADYGNHPAGAPGSSPPRDASCPRAQPGRHDSGEVTVSSEEQSSVELLSRVTPRKWGRYELLPTHPRPCRPPAGSPGVHPDLQITPDAPILPNESRPCMSRLR